MKRNILPTLAITLMVVCFGKTYAQDDLLAYSSPSTNPNNITTRFTVEEHVKVSDFFANQTSSNPTVSVKSMNPIQMKVRIFMTNGDLVKEELLDLNSGLNEVNLDMEDLTKGIYMVQFYSKEGSALRRIVKMD